MVLFEILQRFKGHFLNELRVSFNNAIVHTLLINYLNQIKEPIEKQLTGAL